MCAARSNRQILSQGKKYADKKVKKFGTDEVSFDKDSRLEYLTGFHKRKLQRQKKAREFIKEQERLNKIEERKNIRDERKRQLDERLRNFKQGLELGSDGDDDSEQGEDEEEAGEWNGFESDGEEAAVKPILKTVYSDNSSVSVETLEPNDNFAYLAKINNVNLNESDKVLKQSIMRAGKYAKFLGMADGETEKTKQKKKKFRYLTKGERRRNQSKANANKRRK